MSGNHWDPERETMTRTEIENYQSMKLRKQVRHVYENSRFFRELYERTGVRPEDIRGIQDLYKLPVMSKDDLREQRCKTGDIFSDALCVPPSQLVKINQSTGTSGLPNIFGLTQADWDDLVDAVARTYYRFGVRPGDRTNGTAESCVGWHGWSMQSPGLRRIGCVVFTVEQSLFAIAPAVLEMLAGANLDVIFSYHPEMEINYIRNKGLKPKEIHPNLRFIYGAALTSDARRKLLQDAWGVPYYNSGGGGDQYIFISECEHSIPALHFLEDRFIVEILDPETWEPVEPGKPGELVITNLWAEACPYIRYRTEDTAIADYSPCPCGSTHVRLKYLGRRAWSVNIQGRVVFSDEVENVLWRFPETEFAAYQLVRYPKQPQEELVVRSTCHRGPDFKEENVKDKITEALKQEFGLPARVEFVAPEEIGVGTIKFVRVLEKKE